MKHLLGTLLAVASLAVGQEVQYLPPQAPYLLDVSPLEPPNRYLNSSTGVMDGNRVLYSCGGSMYPSHLNGDHIMRSEVSPTPQIEGSAMTAPVAVMGPSLWRAWYGANWQSLRTFDSGGACDPDVIRIGSEWYMYFGGLNPTGRVATSIGVAKSYDGRNWTVWHPTRWRNEQAREGAGAAILRSPDPAPGTPQRYGSGYPSAVWLDGYVYLFYTDSQGGYYNQGAAFHPNNAGIFVLRSTDPTFQTNVETLSANGFVRLAGDVNSPANHRLRTAYPLQYNYGGQIRALEVSIAAVQYSDMLGAFVVASPGTQGDRGVAYLLAYPDLSRPPTIVHTRLNPPDAYWEGGLGFVRRPDGHSLPSIACGHVPLEVLGNWINGAGVRTARYWADRGMVPANPQVFASRLAGVSTEMRLTMACGLSLWPRVFEGYRLEKAGYPLAVVLNGVRVDLQRGAVAGYLSRNVLRDFSPEQFFSVPNVILPQGALSLQPPGQPAGLVLTDNRVWVTNCPGIIQANGSAWPPRATSAYGKPIGGTLFCLY